MPPLSYAWFLWFTLVCFSEASHGDRDELYTSCLDRCVDKLCGIKTVREATLLPLTMQRYKQQQELHGLLDEHLFQLQRQREKHQQHQRQLLRDGGKQQQQQHEEGGEGEASAASLNPLEWEDALSRNNNNDNINHDHDGNNVNNGGGRRRLTTEAEERGERGQGAVEMKEAVLANARDGGDGGDGSDAAGFPFGGDAGGGGGAAGGGGEGVGGGGGGEGVVDRYVHSPPWHLRAMGWDCVSECGYQCMTMHVESRIRAGEPVQQYHGKWPFRRVWGIQELFASLFSAGNGLPHFYHVIFSRGLYNPPGNYMRLWLSIYPWVGMNTWFWSTVFHARDVPWTEAADYFFALLNIFYVVWMAIVRVAGPPQSRRPRVRKMVPLIGISMSAYYMLHISCMWFVKFDYGYNMKVALVAGLAHTGLWLRYQYRVRDRVYAKRGALVVILVNAAILLEVGDFPPVVYRLVDAHAVWHLVTIPLMFVWYRFIIEDAQYEVMLAAAKTT